MSSAMDTTMMEDSRRQPPAVPLSPTSNSTNKPKPEAQLVTLFEALRVLLENTSITVSVLRKTPLFLLLERLLFQLYAKEESGDSEAGPLLKREACRVLGSVGAAAVAFFELPREGEFASDKMQERVGETSNLPRTRSDSGGGGAAGEGTPKGGAAGSSSPATDPPSGWERTAPFMADPVVDEIVNDLSLEETIGADFLLEASKNAANADKNSADKNKSPSAKTETAPRMTSAEPVKAAPMPDLFFLLKRLSLIPNLRPDGTREEDHSKQLVDRDYEEVFESFVMSLLFGALKSEREALRRSTGDGRRGGAGTLPTVVSSSGSSSLVHTGDGGQKRSSASEEPKTDGPPLLSLLEVLVPKTRKTLLVVSSALARYSIRARFRRDGSILLQERFCGELLEAFDFILDQVSVKSVEDQVAQGGQVVQWQVNRPKLGQQTIAFETAEFVRVLLFFMMHLNRALLAGSANAKTAGVPPPPPDTGQTSTDPTLLRSLAKKTIKLSFAVLTGLARTDCVALDRVPETPFPSFPFPANAAAHSYSVPSSSALSSALPSRAREARDVVVPGTPKGGDQATDSGSARPASSDQDGASASLPGGGAGARLDSARTPLPPRHQGRASLALDSGYFKSQESRVNAGVLAVSCWGVAVCRRNIVSCGASMQWAVSYRFYAENRAPPTTASNVSPIPQIFSIFVDRRMQKIEPPFEKMKRRKKIWGMGEALEVLVGGGSIFCIRSVGGAGVEVLAVTLCCNVHVTGITKNQKYAAIARRSRLGRGKLDFSEGKPPKTHQRP